MNTKLIPHKVRINGKVHFAFNGIAVCGSGIRHGWSGAMIADKYHEVNVDVTCIKCQKWYARFEKIA